MRTSILLAAFILLATSAFAQAKTPTESSRPVVESRPQPQQNYRFHVHIGSSCFFSSSFSSSPDDSGSPFAAVGIVQEHGGPNWQPSSFVAYPQALSKGQQQVALTPLQQQSPVTVQQMLDLYQQVRAVEAQNRLEGNPSPVKWSDLRPALDPADYRRPPTSFMDYSQALALGEQEAAHAQDPNQPPSLGEVAQDQRESKPAEEKAKVVIKQNAEGSPVIVNKKP